MKDEEVLGSHFETPAKQNGNDSDDKSSDTRPPLPWMMVFTDQWLNDRDCLRMDALQRGLFWTLLFASWSDEGKLPDDPTLLWKLARADSFEQFEENKDAVLKPFAKRSEDGSILIHPRTANLYAEQRQKTEKNREDKSFAGKKSAEKRKKHAEIASLLNDSEAA